MGQSQRRAPRRTPPAVIGLPAEIDATNAGRIGEQLDSAIASGAATVIADMTATTFCDSAGARELLLAHHKAAASGTELQIVMPSAAVRRIFQLTGLDQVLAIYPSLAAESADGHTEPAGRETEPAGRETEPAGRETEPEG
jgi:anti-sigma B factor antagonist